MDFRYFEEQEQEDFEDKDGLRVPVAVIEHIIKYDNGRYGYVTVSCITDVDDGMCDDKLLALVIGPETIILNEEGNNIEFSQLGIGMPVNVLYSSNVRENKPAKSNAIMIQKLKNVSMV